VLSIDVDKLSFIRRLSVAVKFSANRIPMWISTQLVNFYFYEDIPLCFRTKKNEHFLLSVELNKYCCFRRKPENVCFFLLGQLLIIRQILEKKLE